MKRIGLTLLAGVMVLVLQAQTGQKITLEDIFAYSTFRSETVTGLRSMNDGEHYSTLEGRTKIVKNSYKTGEVTDVLFDITKIDRAPISSFLDYEFSEDETKILLTTDVKPIYRHSYTAQYYVWNSVTEELSALSENGAQQLATFSPDGDRVAFVRDNNLFIKNLKFGSESQVTWDGKKNEIINGAPDWVYEEEFGFNKAFWWSPDSKFLSFIRFDETAVPEYSMTMYAGEKPVIEENKLYPGKETFKYPKAGETNSTVSVKSYELYSKLTIDVQIGDKTDIYIPRLNWTPDSKDLVVMRMNRRQNVLDILYANPFTGETRPIYTEKNERYISEDFLDAFTYLADGRFVVKSERNGWSHLYMYDRLGFEQGQITKGEFDVTDFYGYDPSQKVFYYQAAAQSPLRREVYFISEDGKKQGKISTLEGTNRADFSKNFNYYVNYYSSSQSPSLITLHDKKNNLIRVLQDNTLLKNKMQKFSLPKKEFFTFKTSEGFELNGYMIKPVEFDQSRKYPVLITQYSGPNSQSVSDSWRGIGWNEYLAQEGFLVVSVDPRGTAARGEDFRKATYLQLGKYESDDMVETAKYLGSLPFVDAGNIAIFGWSYGGFMTLLSMEKGGELFKAGVAVAPVTNWRFYDTIYTERFMRTPRENPEGYDDNSPLTHAADIEGRLLIIHGSADDNVHVQNTYEFTEKLVQAGVQFDMAIYTNRNHSIRGGNTTMHLYTRMTNFLKEQLQ
ncbi:dipeptidyl-peptidase IV Serine peptidase. MEROPS family S09B [Mariniphaga anaerophila]|uniref:Dipeptidyl-peptidase IV Serine peptidase. MEROPS family S09B n=1 Tax=Mariniphaga anaerophila TaxID=1484053 RepID=A0A1M5DHC6_9BACT|nr:S9 family peptidase [Mariniphaga anaerophila]SHF66132.1 dipeptidyl-peptidase IV Serine peptidase. MEROPS family S09B [Mariniphaga anaerophila]